MGIYLATPEDRGALAGDTAFRRLHAIAADGSVLDGVCRLGRLPPYRWLTRLMRQPTLRTCAVWIYELVTAPALFALHRTRLDRLMRLG